MDRTHNARDVLLVGVLLAAVTLAAYWPVLDNDFVSYDDRAYVTENPHVLAGLSRDSVQWALRTGHAGNWHPLTWLSHILDVQLYGLNPAGHHSTSLLLHTVNGLLLFICLRRMTGALWRSATVAALFALHPMHVESVAWVAERKDVLSTCFFLLTLIAYAKYVTSDAWRVTGGESEVHGPQSTVSLRSTVHSPQSTVHAPRSTLHAPLFYGLSLLCFALGLMSKPMLVTLPCVLLLLDFWPLRRMQSGAVGWLVLEKVPFLALSLASSVTTFLIQRGAGAVSSLETLPLEFRISNALISYARYAIKMVWPVNLAVFYPAPSQWPDIWVGAALVVLAGVSALALWRVRTAPYLAVGWFWYLGTLVPVIGLVQVGQQAMADRYSYIPLIGLFLILVWAAADLAGRWPAYVFSGARLAQPQRVGLPGPFHAPSDLRARCGWASRAPLNTYWPAARGWLAAAGAVGVGACAVLTWQQAGYWRNSGSLFEHALAVTHDNAVAQNNLGVWLMDAGNNAAAEAHFAEAVRIRPRYPEALVNLGLCREQEGNPDEAIELLQRAAEISGSAVAHYNLASLLSQRGDLAGAESHYQSALKAKPEFAEAWYNLGLLKAKEGKADEAEQCYTTALRFNPRLAEAQSALGGTLVAQKRFDAAIEHFQAALQCAPASADAQFNLAATLNAKGDFDGAAAHYAEACRLRPEDVEARQKLAVALLSGGKLADAAAQFQEVLRLRPNAGTEHYLALALDAQGQVEAALPHYREAVRLDPKTPLYLNDLAWVLATSPKAECGTAHRQCDWRRRPAS